VLIEHQVGSHGALLGRLRANQKQASASRALALSDWSGVPLVPSHRALALKLVRLWLSRQSPAPQGLIVAQPRLGGDPLHKIQYLPLPDAHGEECTMSHDA